MLIIVLVIPPYTFSRMRFRQFTISAALDTIKELGCKSLRLGAWGALGRLVEDGRNYFIAWFGTEPAN